jgi:hypothetical protein
MQEVLLLIFRGGEGISKTINVTQKGGSLKDKPCKFVFNGAYFTGTIINDYMVDGKRATQVHLMAPSLVGVNYWGTYGGHIGFREIAGVVATGDELPTFTKIYDQDYYQNYNIAKNSNNHNLYGYANNFGSDVLCDFLHEALFANANGGIILTDDNRDNMLIVTIDPEIYALSIGGTVFVGHLNDSNLLVLAPNGPTLDSYESNILIRYANLVSADYLAFLTLDNSVKVDIMSNSDSLNSMCNMYYTPSPSVDNQLKTYMDLVVGGANKPLKMTFLNNGLNIQLVTRVAI